MGSQRPQNLKLLIKVLIGLGLFILFVDAWRFEAVLPTQQELEGERFLDRYGRDLRHALDLRGERRFLIPLEGVPETLRSLFILAEDRQFYKHVGIDLLALMRGLYLSGKQFRKVSGGSTITMQMVRTLYPGLRGFWHRPALMLMALRIELKYSKGEILSTYLNTLPFGHQVAGVGAACLTFFNKSCSELSSAQMAALAIIPRNPSYYVKHHQRLLEKRNTLLTRAGLPVLEETLELARAVPELHAPHLTEQILSTHQGSFQTTLDLDLQKEVQDLLKSESTQRKNAGDSGAALVVDNHSGEVLAYVGSPDFFNSNHGMVDGVQALRSPGSALKPFVYALALENNWDLFSILPDVPIVFSTQKAVYEPHNYGGNFSGPRTMREALGNSKNLPALWMAGQLGEVHVLNYLRKLGFSHLTHDAQHYGIGLGLGNGEVTLWELTEAYSTLARLGKHFPLHYRKQKTLETPVQKIPTDVAYLIADVLRDPDARQEEFGRSGPLQFDFEVGVKTGTSSDFRDHWTLGFTRDITVGVWRGNANSTPLPLRISAARGAGPLFHRIMEAAHRYRSTRWLVRPKSIEASTVCSLSGARPNTFCPLKKREWHLTGRSPKHTCSFHKSLRIPLCEGKRNVEISYVEFPSVYKEWSQQARLPTLENQLREKCNLALEDLKLQEEGTHPIISGPVDQTLYALDPTIPRDHQQIRFILSNIGPNSQLVIDEQIIPLKQKQSGEYYWPLKKGKHAFYIRRGSTTSNVLHIRVL